MQLIIFCYFWVLNWSILFCTTSWKSKQAKSASIFYQVCKLKSMVKKTGSDLTFFWGAKLRVWSTVTFKTVSPPISNLFSFSFAEKTWECESENEREIEKNFCFWQHSQQCFRSKNLWKQDQVKTLRLPKAVSLQVYLN